MLRLPEDRTLLWEHRADDAVPSDNETLVAEEPVAVTLPVGAVETLREIGRAEDIPAREDFVGEVPLTSDVVVFLINDYLADHEEAYQNHDRVAWYVGGRDN